MLDDIDFTKAPSKPPSCVDCGSVTRLALSGPDQYPEKELHGQPIWLCQCGGFGRCHDGTVLPKTLPADAETRAARALAYSALKEAVGRFKEAPGPRAGKKRSPENVTRFFLAKALKTSFYKVKFGAMTRERAVAAKEALDGFYRD